MQGQPGRGAFPDSLLAPRLRRAIAQLARRTGIALRLDEFLPTDLGPDFGDGTVPLFSATGGALVRLEQRPNFTAAGCLLGPRTRLVTGTLSLGKNHSNMLDDSRVRQAMVPWGQRSREVILAANTSAYLTSLFVWRLHSRTRFVAWQPRDLALVLTGMSCVLVTISRRT